MIRHASLAVVAALLFCAPRRVAADGPPVRVEVQPWSAFDGTDRPFRYIVRVVASEPVEIVADRRLLTFELRSGARGRRTVCRHPAAPRRAAEGRIRRLAPGEAWTEWIDLRMV